MEKIILFAIGVIIGLLYLSLGRIITHCYYVKGNTTSGVFCTWFWPLVIVLRVLVVIWRLLCNTLRMLLAIPEIFYEANFCACDAFVDKFKSGIEVYKESRVPIKKGDTVRWRQYKDQGEYIVEKIDKDFFWGDLYLINGGYGTVTAKRGELIKVNKTKSV